MQLNIRTKITLGFGLIITIILILATYLFYSTNQMSSNLKEVDTRVDSLDTVRQTEAEFYQAVAAIRGVIIYKKQEYIDQFDTSMKEMIRLQNHLLSISPPSEHKTINTLIEKTEFYHNGIMEEGAPILEKKAKALAEGKTDEVAFYDAEIARTSAYYGQVTTEITAILHELGEQNRLICDNIITASNESSNSIHKTALILGLFAVVIGIVISILLSRNITAPILEMVSGAKLFALGDFRNKLTVRTRDEIGELAQALNSMAVELGQLISKVVENAQTVAAHSEELAASGEQVSATVEEVASTANEVASVAANGVDNANKAATEIDKMNKAAQEGHKIVKQTIDKINAISDSAASANEAVKNLGDLSAKIGNITKVITDIAEQTNLLALNAAIEAARAGEQGRGFAVVAEEVRKLAEQSGSAAKEISDLIKQIQAGVDEAVHSMEQGTGDVKEGVEYAAMAGHELDNIINAVQDNIAFINDIAAGAKQTSEGTHQLSEANEQVTSTIQQITTAAQELARVSGELQHAVEKFKV